MGSCGIRPGWGRFLFTAFSRHAWTGALATPDTTAGVARSAPSRPARAGPMTTGMPPRLIIGLADYTVR